jgi:aconitate hydratase
VGLHLEYLAKVVHVRDVDGEQTAFPDTLVGTDSHTTMLSQWQLILEVMN